MKNPNFDWEGETQYFKPGPTNELEDISPLEMQFMALTGQKADGVVEKTIYHNYFDRPHKPFFFMGYDQWRTQPYDETSWLEQNVYQQKNLDKRGKQIDETLDNRGHHVWSKESGLKPSDIQSLDMTDPDQDVVVDGFPGQVHEFIPPERPTKQEFDNISDTRNRMYQSAGVNSVQGQVQSPVATTNQIAREANFTRADDMVEDTINAAAEWMASYALQFIKLRYTKEHMRRILGDAGDVVFLKLHRNMISDGMIVKIKASGTDKLRAQNNAMDMAKMELIDPYNFYKMMQIPDPEGMTKDLMDFKINPQAYIARVVKGLQTPEEIGDFLMQQPVNNAPQMPIQPPQTPMSPLGNTPPQGMPQAPQGAPQLPNAGNTPQVPQLPQAPEGSPRMI